MATCDLAAVVRVVYDPVAGLADRPEPRECFGGVDAAAAT